MEDPSCERITKITKARWSIEVYHRELKPTCGIDVRLAQTEHKEIIFVWQY